MKWFITFVIAIVFAQDRGHDAPYVTGDGFRAIADHLYDETYKIRDASPVKPYDIIFIKSDYIDEFIAKIIPDLKVPFIMITHNSDDGPKAHHRKFLKNPYIVAWFAQNANRMPNKKLIPIPIGLENRYVMDAQKFALIKQARNSRVKKDINLYINCSVSTNPGDRKPLYSNWMRRKFRVEKRVSIPEYLDKVARAKFVASPPGNGFDCHRTWEALYMGSYPIVKTSHANPLFDGLPVLFVNNYISFSAGYLEKMYQKYRRDTYNMEKLRMEYWWDLIRSYQKKDHS